MAIDSRGTGGDAPAPSMPPKGERRFNPFRAIVVGVPVGLLLWWAVFRAVGLL